MAIRCVVAAVDGSPESLRAVDWAADEASRRGVRLLLIHACVWERYEQGTEDEDDPASVRTEVRTFLGSAAERATKRCPQAVVDTEVIPQETVSALLGLRHLSLRGPTFSGQAPARLFHATICNLSYSARTSRGGRYPTAE